MTFFGSNEDYTVSTRDNAVYAKERDLEEMLNSFGGTAISVVDRHGGATEDWNCFFCIVVAHLFYDTKEHINHTSPEFLMLVKKF